MAEGTVLSVHTTHRASASMDEAWSLVCVAGKGIEGDRYALGTGTYSKKPEPGRQLTMIESEKLKEMDEVGLHCTANQSRRNVVTQGIELNDLVGKEITVGTVRLKVHRLCQPCGYLEGLISQPGLKEKLWDKGGIRCEILTDGEIKPGDVVTVVG
jgi:MOSC domain-containing protein YiiM